MTNIEAVYERFLNESSWIINSYTTSLNTLKLSPATNRGAQLENEMCIIRIHDSWTRFCRDLVTFSALGGVTKSGTPLTQVSGIHTYRDVLTKYKSTFPAGQQPKFEPKWGTAHEAIKVAQRIGITNLRVISAALGSANSPANDLRVVRNFYAHRIHNTADKIKQLSWFSPRMRLVPQDVPGGITTGGISFFEQWVADLQLIADIASN